MAVAAGRLEDPGPHPREVWLTLGMSVLLHGLLMTAIVLIPHFRIGTYITVPVSYTVSLVSAPPGGRSGVAPAPSPPPATPAAPTQPAPRVAPAPPPAQPTEELTLPGRQIARKPTKAVEPSLRPPIVTGPPRTRPVPPSIAPPLPTPAPAAPVAAPSAPPVASVGAGTGAGVGKSSGVELAAPGRGEGGGDALASYLALVDWKIGSNWVLVPAAGAPEVTVVVRFRVLRSGQVRDVEMDSSSGNQSVDTSALRAVRQSIPLPPFPNLLLEPYLDLRYRFVMERG
jgi:TonB family protein